MSVEIHLDWDVEGELTNETLRHFTDYTVVFSLPPGSIVTGHCGALFRTRHVRLGWNAPNLCPACVANEP